MPSHVNVTCDSCGRNPERSELLCATCGGTLSFDYLAADVQWDDTKRGMWRYWPLLPIEDSDDVVTLGEGGTPLLRSTLFPQHAVYLKDETRNPTGSHKDRQLCVAINHARALGRKASVLVSAGSTGIANSAYAARAGLQSVVFMSDGVPEARVYPVFALGSRLVEVPGPIDPLIDRLNELAAERGIYHSSTARNCNPYQSEGAKTIAFEIVEQLGRAPEWVVTPVGGGGTLASMWRGFTELFNRGVIDKRPRMVGVVPRRFNAMERAFEWGYETHEQIRSIPDEGTEATVQVKLAHAFPPDGPDALRALRESNGMMMSVSDQDALRGAAQCSRTEGLYVEPSTGTGIAGLQVLLNSGKVAADDTVVGLLCGSGFRETSLTMEIEPLERETVPMDGLGDLFAQIEA